MGFHGSLPCAPRGPRESRLCTLRRAGSLFVAGVFLVVGCKSAPGNAAPGNPAAPAPAKIRALGGAQGSIVQVQPALRFVVVDFTLNATPAPDQILKVYRNGQKVGEVKAGRMTRESNVAADIVSGDPQVGDEVRPE